MTKKKNYTALYPHERYVESAYYHDNTFTDKEASIINLPTFDDARDKLPKPHWIGNDTAIEAYWKAWEIAFKNLKNPTAESGFVSPFIDTAFNDCIFMWDSAFILQFGRYGQRIFDFLGTFDNFYAKQHPDGFICREIGYEKGDDRFARMDTGSTGPNVMAWVEWEYFQHFGDVERLEKAFAPLVAYHRWTRENRTWRDGAYWSTGWATGMDNQPRIEGGSINEQHKLHAHQVWIDATLQAILSARMLLNIAGVLGRIHELHDMAGEVAYLTRYVNKLMWDEYSAFYYDLSRDGNWTQVKSIGAYWALLANVVPEDYLERFIEHLDAPDRFKRPHRIPSLAADHPAYADDGHYWRGGVWAPTNYMVLRGLTQVGEDKLAHEIAMNHLANVLVIYEDTDTFWENYAPEFPDKGNPAKPDFVGWSGLTPITILIEYIFGIRADVPSNTIIWDVRLTDEHGIKQYPLGADGIVNLQCEARDNVSDEPVITVDSTTSLTLIVKWAGGKKEIVL